MEESGELKIGLQRLKILNKIMRSLFPVFLTSLLVLPFLFCHLNIFSSSPFRVFTLVRQISTAFTAAKQNLSAPRLHIVYVMMRL